MTRLPQAKSGPSTPDADLGPTETGRSRAGLVVLLSGLWAIILILLGTWATYWAELRNDQYQLIHLGQTVCDGGRMYIDCWENKPPGITWLNALAIALGGGRLFGAWLLPGFTAIACLGMMTLAMARLLSLGAACWTLVVASVVYTLRLYDTPSINPDFYSSMFDLVACTLCLLSIVATTNKRRIGFALAAGLGWAAAVCVKQTGAVGLLVVSVVVVGLVTLKHEKSKRWAVSCALAWLGFALGAGAVVGALAYRQTLDPAWEAIFEFNRGLFTLDGFSGAIRSWSRVCSGLSAVQLPLWLALLAILATMYVGKANRLSRSVVLLIVLWWIVQVLFALIGPSRSMRYWQASFPAMLWLAGVGIYHIEDGLRRMEKSRRIVLALACATVVLLLAAPLFDHYQHGLASSYLTYSTEHKQRARLTEIGEQIQQLVPENRPIYVWAYDAGVYLYAQRRAASTFTYPRSPEQMNGILADLATGQAQAILIPNDRAPEFDRWCDAACQQTRDRVLTAYEMKVSVGRYDIWVRPTLD